MLCSNKCNVRRRRTTTTRLSVSRKPLWRRSALALNEPYPPHCNLPSLFPSIHSVYILAQPGPLQSSSLYKNPSIYPCLLHRNLHAQQSHRSRTSLKLFSQFIACTVIKPLTQTFTFANHR
ncbi:hypothetical protein CTAM01_02685 [Colletotrichum tamarilloi]|uniref:Uncharacterized protein n=1 Tax=Colletotrichum tamarilloi TaxID=1209934 RepID=A0ABQ9RMT0_9PEZI|nr:uncharacterized protein CTAM01_02685 [Colletotrichum tamarilloi]KAK1507573.1 hypothetical protein CTAM01_02685 [Colletotrichum tamarilloi]